MIIQKLSLVNWRNYKELEIEFDSKVNLIIGSNGSGKSNLAEAIAYLSLTRSWRTNDSEVLINDESKESQINAEVKRGEFKKDIQINLKKGEKKVFVNSNKIKSLSELSKLVNVITFSPGDVPLFMESPGQRRTFLDVSISKQNPYYLECLTNYNNLLIQRNSLLKNERVDVDLLSVLTSQLVLEGLKITKERKLYIEQLNQILPNVIKELLGKDVTAQLRYHPFVEIDEKSTEVATQKYIDSREVDLRLQFTHVGPHKEDFKFILNGKDLASYGSQGQNRVCVLGLKLCPYFLIKEEEDKPIVVLDDVASELDETNQSNLLQFVHKLSQVFITATNLKMKDASIIDVSSNKAYRRNY